MSGARTTRIAGRSANGYPIVKALVLACLLIITGFAGGAAPSSALAQAGATSGAGSRGEDPPKARDDRFTTTEDRTLRVKAAGVLRDDEGARLSAVKPSNPRHGRLNLKKNGSFVYTPDENFNGKDSFTYKARNGAGKTDRATVRISVKPANDAPVARGDGYRVSEDRTLRVSASGVLRNDHDVDDGSLSAIRLSGPRHGRLVLARNGSFVYTPNENFNGTDSFAYRARDGAANSRAATVTISVGVTNDVPSAGDGAEEMEENGGPITIDLGALASDAETSDADLAYDVVSSPTAAEGELTGSGSTRAFDPADNYDGVFDIVYTVTDRGDPDGCGAAGAACDGPETSAQGRITVTVNRVNEAPIVSSLTGGPDTAEVDEGGAAYTYDFTVTDGDPGDDFTVENGFPDCGTGGEYVAGSLNTTAAGGSFECRFVDGPNTPTVRIQVNDGEAGSNVATRSGPTVNNVRPGVAFGDFDPDTGFNDATVGESATAKRTYTFTVTDPGEDTFSVVDGYPGCGANGTLSGAVVTTAAGGSFECVFPDGGPAGNPTTSDVEIKVKDSDDATDTDNRLVTVTVANEAPAATFNAPASVNEGEDIAISLTGATDPAGGSDTLEYRFDCGGGYGPYDTQSGTACPTTDDGTVTVRGQVRDEDGGETEYTGTVTIRNVDPNVTSGSDQSSGEGENKDFDLGSFTDPGDDGPWKATVDWGDGSTETIMGSPFNSPGSLGSMNHTYADDGEYTVSVTVEEEGADAPSGRDTFTASVANTVPTATAQTGDRTVQTYEDEAKTITLGGDDVVADPLRFEITSLPQSGKLYEGVDTSGTGITAGSLPYKLSGDEVTYKPDAAFTGADGFDFTACDDADPAACDDDGASIAIQVDALVPTQLALTTQPSESARAGAAFARQPVVQLQNENGVSAKRAGVEVTAEISSGGGTLGGTATATTDASGAASFTDLSIGGTVGDRTLSFSAAGLAGATSGTIEVTAGEASALTFSEQPSNVVASAPITPDVRVEVRDEFGNKVTDATRDVTLAIDNNPSGGTLSGTTTVAAVGGVATFSNLSINLVGAGYTLAAGSGDLTGATSAGFDVTHGPLDHFQVEAAGGGPIGNQLAGTPFNVRVTAQDAYNNTVTGFTGTADFTSTPSGGISSGATSGAFNAGVLSSHDITFGTPGSFTLTATRTGGTESGTSNSFDVQAPPTAVNDGPTSTSAPGQPYHAFFSTAGSPQTFDLSAPGVISNDNPGFPVARITSFGADSLGGTVTTYAAGSTVSPLPGDGNTTGSLTVRENGSITFTPPDGFTGDYTFRYRLTNSRGTSDGRVTIAVGERPAASDDSYSPQLVGNVPINTDTSTDFKVNANDRGDAPRLAIVAQSNGAATLNADGAFTFRPNAGYEGPASFAYTVTNGFGTSAPATVSMNVGTPVWFVKAGAAGGGDGRLDSPFNCLSGSGCFDQATADESNDRIFLHGGSYTGGLTLLDGQRMIGQGTSGTFGSADNANVSWPADSGPEPSVGETAPTITTSALNTNGVNLGNGNTLRGFTVGNTTGSGIKATNVNNATMGADVAVFGSNGGSAVDISGGNGTIDYNGTIENFSSAARSVSVTDRTGGAVNFDGNISGAGILVGSNTGGEVNFTGASKVIKQGQVALNNNNGATINFTGGGLDIDLDNNLGSVGFGFIAQNGGTLNVTGPGNEVATAGDAAIVMSSVNLGANGATFGNVTSSGGANGVRLTSVNGGDLVMNGGSLSNTGQRTFEVSGGNANVTYAGEISNNNKGGISVQDRTGGTVTFSGNSKTLNTGTNEAVTLNNAGTVNFTNGGLDIDTTSGTGFAASGAGTTVNVTGTGNTIDSTGGTAVNMSGVDIGASGVDFDGTTSGGGTNNVLLTNVGTAGTFDLGSGALSGASGDAFKVVGGDGSVSYSGNISNASSLSILAANVQNKTGGTVTLSGNINPTNPARGISVSGNTGGTTVNFSGASKRISTGTAATGVSLTNNGSNGGATVNFTGGGLAITGANDAVGFSATGGGTVTVQSGANANTISTVTGTALNVQNTNIGSGGLNFRGISAGTSSAGPANGIVLSNTGNSGGLTVTGDGTTAGSGGTIRNTTGADGSTAGIGVYLNSTNAPSLSNMQINDHPNFAVRGNLVTNLTMNNVRVTGTNGNNESVDEGSVRFDELTGSASVTGSFIEGGFEDNFGVRNTSGTLDRITFDGNTFGQNVSGNSSNDSLFIQSRGTATLKATLNNNDFTGAGGDVFQFDAGVDSTSDLVVTNNDFVNNHPNTAAGGGGVTITTQESGDLTYNISNNSFRGSKGTALLVGKVFGQPTNATARGSVLNNTIGVPGVTDSGSSEGSGIDIGLGGGGSHTTLIKGNQIRQYYNYGILLGAGGSSQSTTGETHNGAMNATIQGNTIAEPGRSGFVKNGIHLNSGTNSTGGNDAYQVCLDIGSSTDPALRNTLNGTGTEGGTDFRLRQRFATTVRLPGYTGSNTDTASVVSYLLNRNNNPGSTTASAITTVPPGGGFVNTSPAGSQCTQP